LEPACKPLHEMRRVDLTICDVAIGSSSPHRQYLLRPHSNYTINHVLWEYQQGRRRASLTWISSSWYCCQNTSSSHPVCPFLIWRVTNPWPMCVLFSMGIIRTPMILGERSARTITAHTSTRVQKMHL
jgi:hypothetical protein